MKLKILAAILLLTPLIGKSQEPKNMISLSIGVWERDFIPYFGKIKNSYGPVLAFEYQRMLSPCFSLRGKAFPGTISWKNEEAMERHVGLSAGVLWTPFGKKFGNFKIGVSPAVIISAQGYMDYSLAGNPQRDITDTYWGIEFPIRFHIVDKKNYTVAFGYDILTAYVSGKYGLYTAHTMISYGLKF